MSKTLDILNNEYFDWMYNIVCNDDYPSTKITYRKLLSYLYDREFTYIIDMDGNRAEDGVYLRYRFGYDRGYDDAFISSYLDDKPCSVLEMMVALVIRCENNIMTNPETGDKTGLWFWNMITNLGLGSMSDYGFDEQYVDMVVDRFLRREYAPDGRGGLFTVKKRGQDLRSVEILYQMYWYLDEL